LKRLISAAILVVNADASNASILEIALSPATRRRHVASALRPSTVAQPIPVMTTRLESGDVLISEPLKSTGGALRRPATQ
jgi:hypothetical protein